MEDNNFELKHDLRRHWCPQSERFTGGDSLLTALDNGWRAEETVIEEVYWMSERKVTVYQFYLSKGAQTRQMRVMSNPYVDRLILARHIKVVCYKGEKREQAVIVSAAH